MQAALKSILGLLPLLLFSSCAHRTVDASVGTASSILAPSFPGSLARAAKQPWTSGNQITTLANGDRFYPPMLKAIREARKTITFETFAYIPGTVANDFTVALCERAKSGVKVHLILDAIGSAKLNKNHLNPMRACGIEVHLYHPLSSLRFNRRTHRKILITDGKLAFTGGAGFADSWKGNARNAREWRDTMYQIKGPAVAQLQKTFNENWHRLTSTRLTGPAYFPSLKRQGSLTAAFIPDSASDHRNPIAHSILHAINSAERSLLLEQSYFVPNPAFRKALLAATGRGVHISLLLPGPLIDSKPTRHASQNHWSRYLEAGIKMYQFEGSMLHGKLLVADENLTIIGSGNLDDRSFFLNDEVNLHVLSKSFAREQTQMFFRDLKRSRRITTENLNEVLAPLLKRILAEIIAPQL